MKKGFFSHRLCYDHLLLHKHIIYVASDNRVDSVMPFRQEVSFTTFCEGVLFVVSPDFSSCEDSFCQEIAQQLNDDLSLTVGEAILQNTLYQMYAVDKTKPCSLYSITSVDWSTARLKDNVLQLKKIL